MNIEQAKKLIEGSCNLRKSAVWFVNAQQPIPKGRSFADIEAEDSELYINESGKITWTYKANTACSCHPEYHTHKVTYKAEDFVKYVMENMDEHCSEADEN